MSTSKITTIFSNINSLAQLHRVLDNISNNTLHQIDNSDVFTFNRHGSPLTVRVIVDEEDGKITYNVNIE